MKIFAELADDVLAVIKAAGKPVETFVMSELQKLVAETKQTTLGTDAFNLISALESSPAPGATKMAAVVAALVPIASDFVAGGGLPGLAVSVENFVREFAQSAYNDFKAAAETALDGPTAPAAA